MRTLRTIALALPLLFACGIKYGGSAKPTDKTFKLTPDDIYVMGSTACLINLSGHKDAVAVVEAMREEFARLDIPIVEGQPLFSAGATALRDKLIVRAGFWDKSKEDIAVLLTHEAVHYCQRGIMGDSEFDLSSINSRGRARMEVPAFRQSFITLLHIGYSEEVVRKRIKARIGRIRYSYWLHDIDPAQFEKEVLEIWNKVFSDDKS